MNRQQERTILRLWRDWCKLWPEQYGHDSLQVKPEGFDPVFDVVPSQAYKDFYLEVVRDHPTLKTLNVFEVIDTALNQVRAPEAAGVGSPTEAEIPARVASVELPQVPTPQPRPNEADTA